MRALDEFRRLAKLLLLTDRPDHDAKWVVWQIRALYREIPDLALTFEDVRDTFGLDPETCDVVLRALTDVGFLRPRPISLERTVYTTGR